MSISDYLFAWRRLDIDRSDLVLDVGSGGNPSIRADCCADRFLRGKEQRGDPLYIDRPFVLADVSRLPFVDGAFDYVICTHVIEHVQDIEAALAELCRVAGKGYIETPNWIAESVLGWPFHKWLVDLPESSDQLIIRRNASHNPALTSFFHRMCLSDSGFRKALARNAELLTTRYEWHGSIAYSILPDPPDSGKADEHAVLVRQPAPPRRLVCQQAVSRMRTWAKMSLRWVFLSLYGRRQIDLINLLACPACKVHLEPGLAGAQLRCPTCAKVFPLVDGIPHLVDEDGTLDPMR